MFACYLLHIIHTHVDDALQSGNHSRSLSVTLVNQLLRNNDVTVTLQWLREDGVIYSVYVIPETSITELAEAMNHSTFMINLTISYNVQYNVSIVSSLCGATATKVLNYGEYINIVSITTVFWESPTLPYKHSCGYDVSMYLLTYKCMQVTCMNILDNHNIISN